MLGTWSARLWRSTATVGVFAAALLLVAPSTSKATTLFAYTLWGTGPLAALQNGTAGHAETAFSSTDAALSNGGSESGVDYSTLAQAIMDPRGNISLHARATQSSANSAVTAGFVSASSAQAGLSDTLIVHSATQSGMGLLQFSMTFDGTLAATKSGGSTVSNAFGGICPVVTPCSTAQLATLSGNGAMLEASGTTILGNVAFTYNQPFNVSFYLVINSLFVGGPNSFNVDTDFSHTAALAPVSIFNSAGVRDYGSSISSTTSDAVYSTAVPEPSIWAMMILGFGAVGMFVRRRTPTVAA